MSTLALAFLLSISALTTGDQTYATGLSDGDQR